MNIACSADDKFIQHCCIMLTSVLINNEDVDVYLLSEGISSESFDKISIEVARLNGRLHYILINNEVINKLPLPEFANLKHISKATYYRLFLSELLPNSLDKIIYLDCDVIVRSSLRELWNIDIKNYSIGAVYQMYEEIINAKRLGYSYNYGYFNAGVLVVNIQYWREHQISEKLIRYVLENKNKIIYHDQDALNAVLHNTVLRLPCKWNMISFFFEEYVFSYVGLIGDVIVSDYSDYKESLQKDIKNPFVIHYVSKPKPWDDNCLHPYVYEYFKYAQCTLNYKSIKIPNYIVVSIKRVFDGKKKKIKYFLKILLKRIFKIFKSIDNNDGHL